MSLPGDPLEGLRAQVNDQLADNLLTSAGGADAAVASSPDAASLPPAGDDGGASYQQAMLPDWMVERIRRGMAASGADRRLDSTVGRMTGGRFSRDQIHTLEDRALHNAGLGDVLPLRGIEEGPPVVLSPRQKGIIDRLMSQSGSDPLGQAARSAYERAWQDGQIKLRGN